MQLAFLGFGLIGGSIARAVRANPASTDWTMAAWSPSGVGPARAVADGVIDRAVTDAADVLDGADVVILCAPATDCLALIDRLAGPWHARLATGATVTDTASTKVAVMTRADGLGLRFVGGHPMAGRDATGYDASDPELFTGRPWVVVPGSAAGPDDVARTEALAAACGARAIRLDAETHDRAVAGISHLPLLVAAALAEAVAGRGTDDGWATAAALAAGGWRDTTRVARGDPSMGAAIVATNAAPIAARLRDLRAVLDAWLSELERQGGPDEATVRARLSRARALLDAEP